MTSFDPKNIRFPTWETEKQYLEANVPLSDQPGQNDLYKGVPFKWVPGMPDDQYVFDKRVPESIPGAKEFNSEMGYDA